MNASKLVKAVDMLMTAKQEAAAPEGVFGHLCMIQTDQVELRSDSFDFEFEVPFDDDMEPNEAEVTVYNMSESTQNKFKKDGKLTIVAGYAKDNGVIFTGYISKISTKYEGADKVTTIYAIDDSKEIKIDSISFKAGSKASYILQTLLNKLGLPIAVFKPARDWTYKEGTTVDGDLYESIKTYSEVCGVSTYVSKGQIYSRALSEGDNINFTVCADTGLIDAPEPFEEERTVEEMKDVIKGFKLKMLLQYRMTTGAIINLSSRQYNGSYRVRKGKHTYNPDEALTEVEVV